jgi:histidinol-phosphatase (PHP family)
MKIISDFHSHVVRSSALQMVQKAKAMGLRVQGLSEHIFQMREAQPLLEHLPLEGPLLTLDEYFSRIEAAREQTQFDVRIGLEVDFIPEKHAEILQVIQGRPWDFLIGSIHQVGDLQFEFDTIREREEGEALWLNYFVLLRAAARSGAFSLVSHPVRMGKTNAFLPPTFDEELEQLAAEAAEQNVALEINGYDITHYPHLVKRLARACALYKTPMSIGSDAHDPSKIAQGHALSEEILREVGIQQVRIWKKLGAEAYTF